MKITNITVSFGATVNLGNYESLRADITMTGELPDESEFQIETIALFAVVRQALREQLKNSTNHPAVAKWLNATNSLSDKG